MLEKVVYDQNWDEITMVWLLVVGSEQEKDFVRKEPAGGNAACKVEHRNENIINNYAKC